MSTISGNTALAPEARWDDYCYGRGRRYGDDGRACVPDDNELKPSATMMEIIYMSPDGEQLTQGISNELSLERKHHYPLRTLQRHWREDSWTSHYQGDICRGLRGQRRRNTGCASCGLHSAPYTGSADWRNIGIERQLPGRLVSPPIYTRPVEFNGWKVPDVLLSGNPKLIQDWQMQQALERNKKAASLPSGWQKRKIKRNILTFCLQIKKITLNLHCFNKTLKWFF